MDEPAPVPLAIASLSHHHADVAAIEAFRFPDEGAFLCNAHERFKGVVLLQTCNRVEIIVQGEHTVLDEFLKGQNRQGYQIYEGIDALRHLLELASGIDSMIIGEDQIIGQLRRALLISQEAGVINQMLQTCVEKAIHVGVQVRRKTQINRGAVSIGSAAVTLAEELLGSLERRHILVVGSGEMGVLVTKALAAKGLSAIYVANRTYERAVALANRIGGKAVNLRELYHYLTLSDVVISCTSAPHPIIHCPQLKDAMMERQWPLDSTPRPIILIDIAQPRDVEEGAEEIDGVRLFTVDHLRTISENTLQLRKGEVEQAQLIIQEELVHCAKLLRRMSADDMLATLYTWAESIRVRERDRALNRIGAGDPRMAAILDDLTRVMIKKLLADATYAIRLYAEKGEMEKAQALVRAFTEGNGFFEG